MKIRVYSFLISLLVLMAACAPTQQIYWEEARNAAHYSNVGIRHINKGKYQQAIPFFHKALEIDPTLMVAREQLAVAHYHLGEEYLEWQQYTLASEQFKIALSMNPELQIAQQGLRIVTQQTQLSSLGRE